MKLKWKLVLLICIMLVIAFGILGSAFSYGISQVVNSSVASNIAEKTESIVHKANEVVAQADLTKKSSKRLVEEVSGFKV